MAVAKGGAAVGVRRAEFDIDQVQDTVTNPALGDDFLGEFAHPFHRTLEHHSLDALIMIEVGVHGGDGQVMVGMLDAREALRQFTFVMIVDIGEIGHAHPLEVAFLSALLQVCAQDVPHRLAAGGISALLDEFIEGGGELFIERNREAFHGQTLEVAKGKHKPTAESELLRKGQADHDRFERVFMNIGTAIGVGRDLILKSIHVPELRRGRVHVE